jgi:hypothetical protein
MDLVMVGIMILLAGALGVCMVVLTENDDD